MNHLSIISIADVYRQLKLCSFMIMNCLTKKKLISCGNQCVLSTQQLYQSYGSMLELCARFLVFI